MTFLDRLNSPKFDLTRNRSDGKIIKFQQSQALTSHFEKFLEHSEKEKASDPFAPQPLIDSYVKRDVYYYYVRKCNYLLIQGTNF